MIEVTQTELGADNPRGNCLAACLASILELPIDAVPDFYECEQAGRNWFIVLTEFLATRGLQPVEGGQRDRHHIGVGASPRSSHSHAVVMLGDKIVWDPHPSRSGLSGDCRYWIALEPCPAPGTTAPADSGEQLTGDRPMADAQLGKPMLGEVVVYVDEHGVEHLALVTNGFRAPEGQTWKPALNLAYVSSDEAKLDQYGRQIERRASVVHQSSQAAPGNCWKELDT
jgi:hypothetical protein